MSGPPRITTARLVLRGFRREDFEAYAANLADREARPPPLETVDRRTAWRMFAAGVGAWVLNGAGSWAVTLRSTGEVVGSVGAFYRETLFGALHGDLELGWIIYRRHWRNGYASDVVIAAPVASIIGQRRPGAPSNGQRATGHLVGGVERGVRELD